MAWATPFLHILRPAGTLYSAAQGKKAKGVVILDTVKAIQDAHAASNSSKSLPNALNDVRLTLLPRVFD